MLRDFSIWIRTLFTFIKEKKDVISIIISFCVGVGTLLVGYATIRVSNQQVKIAQQQLLMQESLEQPVFRIEEEYIDTYGDDTITFYDTQVLKVHNEGSLPKSIKQINVNKVLKVDVYSDNSRIELLVNLPTYYSFQNDISSLSGQVLTAFSRGNNASYYDLYQESMEHSYEGNYYFTSMSTLIRIDYIDKFDISHSLHFYGKNQISEDEYKNILIEAKAFDAEFNVDVFKMNFSDILKMIERKRQTINVD